MRARMGVAATAGALGLLAAVAAGQQPRGGPDRIGAFLDALRGANAIQCELVLQTMNGWWGSDREPVPDRDPEAWAVVVSMSRRRPDEAAVPRMAAGLRDSDACVRRASARLLGRTRAPAARVRLLEALRDPAPGMRQLGAIGLGYWNDASVEPPLVAALKDRDPGVRAAAAWAIGSLH